MTKNLSSPTSLTRIHRYQRARMLLIPCSRGKQYAIIILGSASSWLGTRKSQTHLKVEVLQLEGTNTFKSGGSTIWRHKHIWRWRFRYLKAQTHLKVEVLQLEGTNTFEGGGSATWRHKHIWKWRFCNLKAQTHLKVEVLQLEGTNTFESWGFATWRHTTFEGGGSTTWRHNTFEGGGSTTWRHKHIWKWRFCNLKAHTHLKVEVLQLEGTHTFEGGGSVVDAGSKCQHFTPRTDKHRALNLLRHALRFPVGRLSRFKLSLPQCNVPGVLNCMSGRSSGFPSFYWRYLCISYENNNDWHNAKVNTSSNIRQKVSGKFMLPPS